MDDPYDVDPQTGLSEEERDELYWEQRLNRIRFGFDFQRRYMTPPLGPKEQWYKDWDAVLKWNEQRRERPEPLEPWD